MAWMLNAPIAVAVCVGVLAWDIRKGLTAGVLAFATATARQAASYLTNSLMASLTPSRWPLSRAPGISDRRLFDRLSASFLWLC
jgi:hypothetical protein